MRHLFLAATTFVTLAALMPSSARAGDGQTFDMQVGGVAAVRPKYEGSKEYEVIGYPIIAPAGSGRGKVQFRGIDDIRYRLFEYGRLEVGPVAGYQFGRDEDDADRLDGLGDVDGGLVLGAYAAYDLGAIKPFLSYHHQLTGDDSALLRFGAETQFRLWDHLTIDAVAGATWANSDHMQSYFSVPDMALPSGLTAFDASSGIKDVYVGLATTVPLTDRWDAKVMGRYSQLIGDAADSPIVETEHQFSGGLGLVYKFSVDR